MLDQYYTIYFAVMLMCLYWISFILVSAKIIRFQLHCKIWNWLLAFVFGFSSLLGVILAISIDQKISISWYRTVLWFHVEFGIAMAIITFFHLLWHFRYFFPKKPAPNRAPLA